MRTGREVASMRLRYRLHALKLERDESEDDGQDNEQRRRRVDLGRYREADHRIDLYREGDRVGAAGEIGDDEIVEAEREGQQRAGNERGPDVRDQHVAEHLPFARAEILRRFLLLAVRSEEHTYELQSLMRTSYAVFCLT